MAFAPAGRAGSSGCGQFDTTRTRFISARKSTKSPAFLRALFHLNRPVLSSETGFDSVKVTIGDREVASEDPALLKPALEAMGYSFDKQIPAPFGIAVILVALLGLSALSGFTYGPVAALLSEMFPPHVRYSSLSIPYHLGTGYFGGFLPLIASFIVAKTGNAYAGLWYTWVVVLVAFLVSAFLLKEPVEGEWDKPASAAGDAA